MRFHNFFRALLFKKKYNIIIIIKYRYLFNRHIKIIAVINENNFPNIYSTIIIISNIQAY